MGDDRNSARRPLEELCDIVARHHADLQRALPLIRADLETLTTAGVTPPRESAGILEAFGDFARQLEGHVAKEEHVLFPALEALARADREGRARPALPFPTVLYPIRMMETEHARIETAMDRLREIVRAVVAAAGASDGWRRCLSELSQLDADLRDHHRAENEELFPSALELERRLP